MTTSRLLILSCSQRKAPVPGRIPALFRYDGPAFRVLRKYQREHVEPALTVLILSAKFGLVESGRLLPDYDCRLRPESIARLRSTVQTAAKRHLRSQSWCSIAVCVGKDYRLLLDGLPGLVPAGTPLHWLGGGLGPRLTALRDWLRNR